MEIGEKLVSDAASGAGICSGSPWRETFHSCSAAAEKQAQIFLSSGITAVKHAGGRAVPLAGTEIPPHPPCTSTGPETSPAYGVGCWVLHLPAEQEQAPGAGACSPWPGGTRGSRVPPALSLEMEHLCSSTHTKIRRQTGASWQPASWVCCLSLCHNAKPGKCVWRSLQHVWRRGERRPACGHPAFGHSDGRPRCQLPPRFPCPPSRRQMDSIGEKHPYCPKPPFLSKNVARRVPAPPASGRGWGMAGGDGQEP